MVAACPQSQSGQTGLSSSLGVGLCQLRIWEKLTELGTAERGTRRTGFVEKVYISPSPLPRALPSAFLTEKGFQTDREVELFKINS